MRAPLASWPRTVIAVMCVAATLGFGCHNDDNSSLSASFMESGTATAPLLVKLVQKSVNNSQVVVQAVIYGPDTTLDMYTFAFDVKIADPTIVGFVAGSAVEGGALQAFAGQTIETIAELGTLLAGGVDNSLVVVGVSKLGGGVGNGIAGTSAVVVALSFQVLKAGTTTLTLTGSPTPQVLDSGGTPIGTITFDAASASMTGVSTGGGGY